MRSSAVVETSCGSVRGGRRKTLGGRKIYYFSGIPYAKPPVGPLRFRRSGPCDPWDGVLQATRRSKPSLQPNLFYPTSSLRMGSEDCLYLNVYTPQLDPPPSLLKPVLVFIHGGAFAVGSNDPRVHGPDVLLDEDIVLVCMNYRLGPLGFLSLETDSCPGNLGLHDQYLALSWVRTNIASFGGDPSNVTLMGESAGAMSAMLHTISPISSGLFQRVVALSGTPSTVFLKSNRTPRLYATALAERLGFSSKDPEEILKFLQVQKVGSIVQNSMMFMDWDYPIPLPWVPIRDEFCSQPFIPQSFEAAIKSESVARVPILYCFCKDEGLLLTSPFHREPERLDLLRDGWDTWAPLLLLNKERELHTDQDVDLVRRIRQFYFGTGELDASEASLSKLKDMYSMSFFVSPLMKDAALLREHHWDVSIMRLSVPPAFSILQFLRRPFHKVVLKLVGKSLGWNCFSQSFGVCHGDDLLYLFNLSIPTVPRPVQTSDQRFARRTLLAILSNFARSSEPFLGLVGEEQGPSIVSLEPGERVEQVLVSRSDLADQLLFWQELPTGEHQDYSLQPPGVFHKKTAPFRK